MERIGSKILRLIKEKGYKKPNDFYKKIVEIYGPEAIERFTLTRILENRVMVREKSLQQIATVLLVTTQFIRKNTNAENIEELSEEITHTYSGGSKLKLLEKNLPFVIEEITLKNVSSKFSPDEFEDISSSALLDEIEKANIKLPERSKVKGNINKLNYLLKTEDLRNKFKNIKISLPQSSEKKSAKANLINLNRTILETVFPLHCPKNLNKKDYTDEEQDDPNAKESLKWILVMNGKAEVIIKKPEGEFKQVLKEGQKFSFDARQKHYFKNLSKRTAKLLVIHYPALNNIFSSNN